MSEKSDKPDPFASFVLSIITAAAVYTVYRGILWIYSLVVETTMEAIAWATSIFLIVLVICAAILIGKRMEEETKRRKDNLELGNSDVEFLNNDAKMKQLELENLNLQLTKEIESARHVQAIAKSKHGIQ